MNLFKLLGNALRRDTGRTQAPQEMFAMSDRQSQVSALSSEQVDPTGALRQAINELNCYNTQEPSEPGMNRHGLEESIHSSQTEIHLANWGAEQGNWGQRFAA